MIGFIEVSRVSCGALLLIIVPKPNCPFTFNPQVYTFPSSLTPIARQISMNSMRRRSVS